MQDAVKLLIGILVLALSFPIGNLLAKFTKEELKSGQKWLKLVIILSFFGAIISLIFREDALLFTFLLIIIITSRSLKMKKRKN